MRVGVIGGGRVGRALAASWSEKGHDVVVSTRETVAETAAAGDVLVVALPATEVAGALAQIASVEGKVVIDATNNLSGGPAGLDIAALAPAARYVKAFNTVFSTFMHASTLTTPPTLVYCGDDADAKAITAELIADLGFEPVDAGGADVTPLVEAFAQLVIGIAYRQGRGPFVYRFESS